MILSSREAGFETELKSDNRFYTREYRWASLPFFEEHILKTQSIKLIIGLHKNSKLT